MQKGFREPFDSACTGGLTESMSGTRKASIPPGSSSTRPGREKGVEVQGRAQGLPELEV